jgi:microcystin-dependent protein
MAQPYVGEIRMFAGTFAPVGWMFCDGQLLPISENETLFQIIGTTYGGDGQSTFALPNLQSRIPLHQGTNGQTFLLGEAAGVESVTLTTQQIPIHTHPLLCAASGGIPNSNPKQGFWAATDQMQYSTAGGAAVMGTNPNPLISDPAGGSQPHENLMPYLCVNFIISLFGLFPSQT